jgi:hypothetical protein
LQDAIQSGSRSGMQILLLRRDGLHHRSRE